MNKHACKNCKWKYYFRRITGDYCRVPSNAIMYFDPVKGMSKKCPIGYCELKNKDGNCEDFKPSLFARVLRLFGRKY